MRPSAGVSIFGGVWDNNLGTGHGRDTPCRALSHSSAHWEPSRINDASVVE